MIEVKGLFERTVGPHMFVLMLGMTGAKSKTFLVVYWVNHYHES